MRPLALGALALVLGCAQTPAAPTTAAGGPEVTGAGSSPDAIAPPTAASGPFGAQPPAQWDRSTELPPTLWQAPLAELALPRVSLAIRGSVWVHPAGPAWGATTGEPFEHPTTFLRVEDAFGLRILAEFGGVRILLYASPEDLAMVVRRPSPLHDAPGSAIPPADARVELLRGAAVTVTDRQGPWVAVTHRSGGRELSGWLPAEVVGIEFSPSASPEPPAPHPTRPAIPGTQLLARTGRASVFTLDAADPGGFLRVHARVGRLWRVTYEPPCDAPWRVQGYLPRTPRSRPPRTTSDDAGCPLETTVSWGALLDADRVAVGPGVALAERPGGRVIGRTLRAVELARDGAGTLWLPTPWGPVPVAPRQEGPGQREPGG